MLSCYYCGKHFACDESGQLAFAEHVYSEYTTDTVLPPIGWIQPVYTVN